MKAISVVVAVSLLAGCATNQQTKRFDTLFSQALSARGPQALLIYGEFKRFEKEAAMYLMFKFESGTRQDKAVVLDILDKANITMDPEILKDWQSKPGDAANKTRIDSLLMKQAVGGISAKP